MQNEQLLILYENVLVTIDAFSLLQTLRVCWNQLQKGNLNFYLVYMCKGLIKVIGSTVVVVVVVVHLKVILITM